MQFCHKNSLPKRFHFVHSVFMGNKGDAEKMKVLITEERYRHEAKFAEPESNPSNHNFAIAVSARGVGVASPLAFVHFTKYQRSSVLATCFLFEKFLLLPESFQTQQELWYSGTLSSSSA